MTWLTELVCSPVLTTFQFLLHHCSWEAHFILNVSFLYILVVWGIHDKCKMCHNFSPSNIFEMVICLINLYVFVPQNTICRGTNVLSKNPHLHSFTQDRSESCWHRLNPIWGGSQKVVVAAEACWRLCRRKPALPCTVFLHAAKLGALLEERVSCWLTCWEDSSDSCLNKN